MPLTVTKIEGGRIEIMFDHPIAPLSGQTLSILFHLPPGDEMVSKGKGVMGIRCKESDAEAFLDKVDPTGKAKEEYLASKKAKDVAS